MEICPSCYSFIGMPIMHYCNRCKESTERLSKCRECGEEILMSEVSISTCRNPYCRVDSFYSCPDHPTCPACGVNPIEFECIAVTCEQCNGDGFVIKDGREFYCSPVMYYPASDLEEVEGDENV